MPRHAPLLFLSYLQKDIETVNQILTVLQPILADAGAVAWEDRKIGAGQGLNESIERALQEVDIYLVFITRSFLMSPYRNFELGVALGRLSNPDVILIPVVFGGASRADLPRSVQALVVDGGRLSMDELRRQVVDAVQAGLRKLQAAARASS